VKSGPLSSYLFLLLEVGPQSERTHERQSLVKGVDNIGSRAVELNIGKPKKLLCRPGLKREIKGAEVFALRTVG
jgi:hypothetical protein